MRGLFFVFEGMDGSGQDTQAQRLAKALTGKPYRVWLTREPTDGLIGQRIRSILKGESPRPSAKRIQQLMVRDRTNHVQEINQHLHGNEIVISVRYLYSTLAYGVADGLNYLNLWWMNEKFPRPNLAIYLDLDPEIAMQRITERGKPAELFEKQKFLTKVRNNFLKLAKDFPEFRVVNAVGDIETVHQRIMTLLYPFLKQFAPSGH